MALESEHFPPGIFLPHHDVVRPITWAEQYSEFRPLHLEIGFGLGEFLIQQADHLPKENFIGVEQDWGRIYKCLQKISAIRKLPGKSSFGDNLRLLKADITVALQRLITPRTIDQVTCLFPCPWPKKSHIKYRLFSREFLCLLNSRVKDGAQVKIVTDWQPYFDWMLTELEGTGFAAKSGIVPAQFGTKFERKWRAGGQESFWELQLTKISHVESEVKVYFLKDFNPGRFRFENVVGEISVILKDFFFDPAESKGLVRLVVAEKFLTQHVLVVIVKSEGRWFVAKADGHSALPTNGVALGIEKVFDAAQKSIAQET